MLNYKSAMPSGIRLAPDLLPDRRSTILRFPAEGGSPTRQHLRAAITSQQAQRFTANRPIGARRPSRRPTMHRRTLVSQLVVLSALLLIGQGPAVRSAAAAGSTNSFQLSSPIAGTLPFTVGIVFKKGEMTGTPVLDIPNQQVIVKRRWNDNSVKHAVASGHIALSANTPRTINVVIGTAPSGNLTPADIQGANPQASVSLGGYGTVNLSSLLSTPFRTWVSGPEMVEAHYRSSVGADPTLVVWFYVRYYRSGRVWVRAIVENGYLDRTTADKVYVPTVSIGGTIIY